MEYLDEDGSIDVSELYEANDDGEGTILATNEALTKKDINMWNRQPGLDFLSISAKKYAFS